MTIKFKDTQRSTFSYEFVGSQKDNGDIKFIFAGEDNGLNQGTVSRTLDEVMHFFDNNLVEFESGCVYYRENGSTDYVLHNIVSFDKDGVLLERQDINVSNIVHRSKLDCVVFWKLYGAGYITLDLCSGSVPLNTSNNSAKTNSSCQHLNKYVNYAGGTGFWFCPDCKADLGNA